MRSRTVSLLGTCEQSRTEGKKEKGKELQKERGSPGGSEWKRARLKAKKE